MKLLLMVVGSAFVGGLAWLTSWPYAVYAFGMMYAGVASQQAASASPLEVPMWMSSDGGKLVLTLVTAVALFTPLLMGFIWYRWWWGVAAYILAGIGAALWQPAFSAIVRFFLGLLIGVSAAVSLAM